MNISAITPRKCRIGPTYCVFQISELDELKPIHGEIEKLEQEHKRLANVESLLSLGQQAINALNEGDETLVNQTQSVLSVLQDMAKQDEGIKDTWEMVDSARIQLEEAASTLSHYLNQLDIDPERYQEVDNRISSYFQLARKHRTDTHELAGLLETLQQELDDIDGGEEKLAQLEAAAQAAREQFLAEAKKLSKAREKAAKKLSKLITEKVQPLGMPGAEFKVELASTGRSPIQPNRPGKH